MSELDEIEIPELCCICLANVVPLPGKVVARCDNCGRGYCEEHKDHLTKCENVDCGMMICGNCVVRDDFGASCCSEGCVEIQEAIVD